MNMHRFLCRATYALPLACALFAQPVQAADGVPLAPPASLARDLVPALAFHVDGFAAIQDVAVEGTFPQSFRLTTLPTPPADVLASTPGLLSLGQAPVYYVAKLTAVPRGHPPLLRPPTHGVQRACTDAACTDEVRVCAEGGERCARVVLVCNVVGKDCKITSIEGDPELVRQSLYLFEGRSDEHRLLYLTADAPAGSMVSQLYASYAPLAAGYHLLQRRSSSEDELERTELCEAGSQRVVLGLYSQELGLRFSQLEELLEHLIVTRYNARHGTRHEHLHDVDVEDPGLAEVLEDVYAEAWRRVTKDMVARKCLLDVGAFGVVGAVHSRTLSVPLTNVPKVGDTFLAGTPWKIGNVPIDWP